MEGYKINDTPIIPRAVEKIKAFAARAHGRQGMAW